MGHRIGWDNQDKTVVLQEYMEGASKDDLYHLVRKSAEMLDMVSHRVHVIIDERPVNLIISPGDMTYLEKYAPKNQGIVVAVIPVSRFAYKKALQNLGRQFAPNAFEKGHFAESIEQARILLQNIFQVNYP